MASKKPANDNGHAELEKEIKNFFQTAKEVISNLGKRIKELTGEKEQLQKENSSKEEELKSARESNEKLSDNVKSHTKEISDMGKAILGALVALLVVGGLIWAGYALRGPNQYVADETVIGTKGDKLTVVIKKALEPTENALAGLDKKVGEIDKQVGFNKMQVEGLKDQFASLQRARLSGEEHFGDVVSMSNWSVLNVTSRAKVFQDACQGKVNWDSINTELYQAGLAYVTKDEAKTLVSTCDADAIVKKAPVVGVEANNDTADKEDQAVEQQQAVVTPAVLGPQDQATVQKTACERGSCNLTIAPSPFVQSGYGRPGYGPGYGRPGYGGRRAYCPTGSVMGAGGCVHVLTRVELARIPRTNNDPRCRDGVEGYWSYEGGMKLHHRCVYR